MNVNRFGKDLLAGFVAALAALSVALPSRLVQGSITVVVVTAAVIAALQAGRRIGGTEISMLLWTLLTIASWSWTTSSEATLLTIRVQLGVCGTFLLIRLLADRPRVLAGAAVGYLAGCLAAVYQIWQTSGLRLSLGFENERAVIEELDQNYLAYAMSVGLLLLIFLWSRAGVGVGARLAIAATGALLILGSNEAGTRGAFVAIAGLFVWLLVSRLAPTLAFRTLVALAAVLSIIALTGFADDYLRQSITASERERGDLNGRLVLWPLARDLFHDHPWFGIGAGAFRDSNPLMIVAHDAPLEIASGLGLVGLALFYGTLFFALVADTRSLDPRVRAQYVGGLIVLITPILLSGHWYQAPALWVAIAGVSRLKFVEGGMADGPAAGGAVTYRVRRSAAVLRPSPSLPNARGRENGPADPRSIRPGT